VEETKGGNIIMSSSVEQNVEIEEMRNGVVWKVVPNGSSGK